MKLDVDNVAQKNDLVEIVEKSGGHLRRVAGEWRGPCILHKGNNLNAFAIYNGSDGRQRWKCFTSDCGSGDVYEFIMKFNNCDFVTAYRILGGEENPDPQLVRQAASERTERAAVELAAQIAKAQATLAELRHAQAWIKYHEQLDVEPSRRELWAGRGIPEVWQDLWSLGYDPSFTVSTDIGLWRTPTLSIPIFAEGNPAEPISLRHRLLNPPTPGDKYRPDRPGLKAVPFIADPENKPENVLVVEGEVKSMVAYITLDSVKWQVMGIPGKSGKQTWLDMLPQLIGRQVVICLDPDALPEALEMARAVGGRVMELTGKIDDIINAGDLDREMLRRMIRASRKVSS